jgi:hypothetical protein
MEFNAIVSRLKDQMGPDGFEELISVLSKSKKEGQSSTNILKKHVHPKITQFGLKVQNKHRQLLIDADGKIFRGSLATDNNLASLKKIHSNWDELLVSEKYPHLLKLVLEKGQASEIDHTGLWINNELYHWGSKDWGRRDWEMYGSNLTNREITNDWTIKSFEPICYTMKTIDEINEFCDEWKKNNNYDSKQCNDKHFNTALMQFMMPKTV